MAYSMSVFNERYVGFMAFVKLIFIEDDKKTYHRSILEVVGRLRGCSYMAQASVIVPQLAGPAPQWRKGPGVLPDLGTQSVLWQPGNTTQSHIHTHAGLSPAPIPWPFISTPEIHF